jgi:four helix bundle protein
MSKFQDLEVWQRARLLARSVYETTRTFPRDEMFGLTAQMRRAAISIVCNIAEGHGRYTRGEYAQFVTIARGSTTELEAQIIIARDLGYVSESNAKALTEKTTEIVRMLNGLLRFIRSQKPAPRALRPAP